MASQYIERLEEYIERVEKERNKKVSYAKKYHRYSRINDIDTLKNYFDDVKSRTVGEASGLVQALEILDEIFPELKISRNKIRRKK